MSTGARPYAEALFAIARGRGDAADVLGELAALDEALPREGRALLMHPSLRPEAAAAVLDAMVRQVSPLVGNFLRVLAGKRRFALLSDIVVALRARLDEAEGRVRARVQTARPLEPGDVEALSAALARRVGHHVEVITEIRPDLMGGARVLMGDRVLDGSVSGHLAALRRRMLAARN